MGFNARSRDRSAAQAGAATWATPTPGDAGQAKALISGRGYQFLASPSADRAGVYILSEEVTSAALVQSLGGRSASADLTVDCARMQSGVSSVQVYRDSGRVGPSTKMKPFVWLKSAPTDLLDLTEAVCAVQRQGAELQSSTTPPAVKPTPVQADPSVPTPSAPEASSKGSDTGSRTDDAPGLAATHWVQLGAFASAALAEQAWLKLDAAAQMGASTHRLEPVSRGGGRLLRLLAGPYATIAAAQSACMAARRAGAACLVR